MIDRASEDARTEARPAILIGAVVGLTAALCLMLLAFSAPPMHSGPHDVPLAVSGPGPAVSQVREALEEKTPGGFDVTVHSRGDQVTKAIEDREAVGGLSVAAEGVEVQTASAAGVPYATLLRSIGAGLAAEGMTVTYTDVVPLTSDDPTGAGIASLALPLAIGGTISAALLATLVPRRRTVRVAGSLVFSVLTGLATTAVLQYWLGAIDGGYWATAAGVGLGIAAISLTILGLESLLGYGGIAVGALTMVFVANPLSAIAAGPAWLPQPWGDIGQLLPIGAAGSVIRSAAFFDGAGSERAFLVLAAWIAVGVALLGASTLTSAPATGSRPPAGRGRDREPRSSVAAH